MDASTFILEFSRWYLALFFTGVAIFYTSRILFKQKELGEKVVFTGTRFSKNWWNHTLFKFFRAAIWAVCVIRVFTPQTDEYLGVIDVLYHWEFILLGMVLLASGFFFTLNAHMSLGKHWRSGINPKGPQGLKTDRIYAVTRNPMFLGIATAQLGLFFALPSAFTLVCLCVGWSTLYNQAIAEESHLQAVFKEKYEFYRAHVPRWL